MNKSNILNTSLIVIIGTLVLVGTVSAATTISTDITTGGVLTVSGTSSSTFVGAVGIGTTSPYAKLSVVGDVVAARFVATSSSLNNSFAGSVGIGVVAPSEKLEVAGNVALTSGAARTIQVADTADGAGYNLTIKSGNSGGGISLAGSNLYFAAGDHAFLGAGGKVYIYGGLGNHDLCTGICSGGAHGDVILAHTGSGYRGNVGIGTESPAARLDVLESGSYPISFGDTTVYAGRFVNQASRSSGGSALINVALYASAINGQNNYAAIFENGNVGIGTAVPESLLHVSAGTNATTTVIIGKTGQNKGSCLELFDSAGTPVYAYVAAGASTFTLSAVSCK